MTTLLLIVGLALLLGNFLVSFALLRSLARAKKGAQQQLESFLSAPDENTPSPFVTLVDKCGAVIAGRVGTSVMAAIRGALGGTQKGINAEEQGDLVQSNPTFALVNALSPKLSKKLGKNPALLMGLQGILGNLMGGNAPGNGGSESQGGLVQNNYVGGRKHHE